MAATWRLLTDRYVLTGAGLCLLLIGASGWSAFGEMFRPPTTKPAYTHLHCPACLDEYNYFPEMEGKPCPSCGEPDARLVPTVGPFAEGGYTPGQSQWGRVLAFLVITVVSVEGQFLLCVWRGRVLRDRAAADRNRKHICRCPFCNRKIAYPVRKAGAGHACPFCKTGFLLPNEDDPEDEDEVSRSSGGGRA